MSIALESNTSNHQIDRSGFVHGMSCIPIYDAPDPGRFASTDRIFSSAGERENDSCSESSSSSIGRNSDDLSTGRSSSNGDGESGDGEEVQSQFKGALDSMDALEEVLPVKRGISKFYDGKSKSFTSLRDAASCSSTKDIVKPDNAYTRKRKNLLAYSNFWDKSRNHLSRNNSGGGISKRLANSSRSTLALAVTMSSTLNNNNSESSNSNSSSPSRCLPPLPPQNKRPTNNESLPTPLTRNLSSWRSFSLSDLQCAAAAATAPIITSLVINNRDEDKLH